MDSENVTPSLQLEDVARAAAELAAERELAGLLAKYLDRVREWASPSALLAAVRDSSAETGWRLLSALSFGSGPLGVERSLPQLVESAPGCLERPTIIHPDEEVPGVKPRDNCIVPWSHEGESGILVLRGIPRPAPTNLGEAVTLLSAPVWPRLLGGPAPRFEGLLAELQRVAYRLEADAGRQIERLRAARAPLADESAGDTVPAGRVAELEQQLETARQDAKRLAAEQARGEERLLALDTALKESEAERDRARGDVEKLEARAGALHAEHDQAVKSLEERCRSAEAAARTAEEVRAASQRELDEARAEAEHSTLEWDELKGRVAALQEALQDAEGERDGVRGESERLSARIESIQSEHTSAVAQLEERRRTAETALRKALEDLTEAQREARAAREAAPGPAPADDGARERLATLEAELNEAHAERDQARTDVERIQEQYRQAEEALRAGEEARVAVEREAESTREAARTSQEEGERQKERVSTLEAELENARLERDQARTQFDQLRSEMERLEEQHRTTEAALKTAEGERDAARRDAESPAGTPEGEDAAPRDRESALETELKEARAERDQARSEAERLEEQHRAAEKTLKTAEEERDAAQREAESIREAARRSASEVDEQEDRVSTLEKDLKNAEADRDRIKAELERLEEKQKTTETALETAREQRSSAQKQLAEARKRRAAEGKGDAAADGGDAVETLRNTLAVLRRTPFVAPGLRVSMDEAEKLLPAQEDHPEPWLRVALLDRDASGLDPLAAELEEAGLDVKVANYPEELALLMKTPDAQRLDVAICDILAFRPDQTVAGLFRGWQKDRPGLAFFLSFNNEDAAESERAKRVPISLTAGRLPRPIPAAELIEKLRVLAQKQAASDQ